MSNINIEISNNVVVVTIDNKYCGTSVIPKEYNNEPVSVFAGHISDCITKAIEDAKGKMWPRDDDSYYYVNLTAHSMYGKDKWDGYPTEMDMKERGLIFKTKEEAIKAAKKMLEAIK